MATKRKTIWDLSPGLVLRVTELVREGLLKKGVDYLLGVLNKESEIKLSKRQLVSRLDELVWTREALELLKKFVREGSDLTPVYRQLDHLPKSVIDAKIRSLRGVTPGGSDKKGTLFEAGIGRIATDDEVECVQKDGVLKLKEHTLESPFKVRVRNHNNFRVLIVNGPHMGLEYNRVLDENALRNVFRHAKRANVDAIIVTAGLMWTDMKKSAGSLTTHRALYAGLDFDPKVIDPDYKEEAIAIRRDLPPDKIGFTTLRERVMNAFGGWRKVTTHKDGSPIFEGPVYFIFGYPESEMIENAAHEHLRYLKILMERDAKAERQEAEAELRYALKKNDGVENAEVRALKEEVDRLLRLEKRKSANTNIDPDEHRRFVPIIRTLLVSWFMKAIPNSVFVGQGSVLCDVGGRKIDILQASHERPTERDIADLIKSVGQRDLDGTLPDAILGAGAYNLNCRWSARECMRGTEMDQVQVWQLPVLVDRDYIRGAKSEMLRKASPVERLVMDVNFEPGAFMLGFVDGLWDSHPLPISMFTQRYPKTHLRCSAPKELCIYVEGDQHSGNAGKEYVYDGLTRETLPMEVAASEIFMREFVGRGEPLPFHLFSSHGDSTQGRHFQTERNRHPQHESMGVLESESAALMRSIESGGLSSSELKDEARKMLMRLNKQIRLRGEHWYQQQMEDFVDHSIERRAKFFLEILKSGKAAKVTLRGISQVLSGDMNSQDRRDLGRINLLDGNHGENTTEGTMTEAWFFARICLLAILARDDCPFTRQELQRLVRSPIFGPVASGYGLVSVPGGYEWGLHLRHDPTRKSGQDGDPLARATRNLAERGDYGYIFNRRSFITIVGDQHRYAAAYAPNKQVFNCGCGTHGDSYGDDWGFSKSNLGGLIVCVPVEGPGAGPVRIIPISHVFIRRFMKKPWKIDWKKVFPNPVGL